MIYFGNPMENVIDRSTITNKKLLILVWVLLVSEIDEVIN